MQLCSSFRPSLRFPPCGRRSFSMPASARPPADGCRSSDDDSDTSSEHTAGSDAGSDACEPSDDESTDSSDSGDGTSDSEATSGSVASSLSDDECGSVSESGKSADDRPAKARPDRRVSAAAKNTVAKNTGARGASDHCDFETWDEHVRKHGQDHGCPRCVWMRCKNRWCQAEELRYTDRSGKKDCLSWVPPSFWATPLESAPTRSRHLRRRRPVGADSSGVALRDGGAP